ncbi:MAG: hypothetical protein P1U77_25235 [Rubripirellula sp.]|nr:hypothetical protein [Rubripirellula sp.]
MSSQRVSAVSRYPNPPKRQSARILFASGAVNLLMMSRNVPAGIGRCSDVSTGVTHTVEFFDVQ